jgi:hypothetical protein
MKNKTTISKHLHVILEPELSVLLEQKCTSSGRSRKFIVNHLLEKYLCASSKKLLREQNVGKEK